MAVPKRRHSNQRTRKRRTHDVLTPPSRATCQRCGTVKKPHEICGNCGYYAGRDVLKLEGV